MQNLFTNLFSALIDRLPAKLRFAVPAGVLVLILGALFATGCQTGYFDRNNQQAVAEARERARKAEETLKAINEQKAAIERALGATQAALAAAQAAGVTDAATIEKLQNGVKTAIENKDKVFKMSADAEKALADSNAGVVTAQNVESAAERDWKTLSAAGQSVGASFGPLGALATAILLPLGGILVKKLSDKTTEANLHKADADAGRAAVLAIEEEKKSDRGGQGNVAFSDPVVKVNLMKGMGPEGVAFVTRTLAEANAA